MDPWIDEFQLLVKIKSKSRMAHIIEFIKCLVVRHITTMASLFYKSNKIQSRCPGDSGKGENCSKSITLTLVLEF